MERLTISQCTELIRVYNGLARLSYHSEWEEFKKAIEAMAKLNTPQVRALDSTESALKAASSLCYATGLLDALKVVDDAEAKASEFESMLRDLVNEQATQAEE